MLRPRLESVKTGRDFTQATLLGWDMAALTDAAELVVSELVTNALRHGIPSAREPAGGHHIRLRLLAQAPFVMCMVADPGIDIPVLRESGPTEESGRGLNVVECLQRAVGLASSRRGRQSRLGIAAATHVIAGTSSRQCGIWSRESGAARLGAPPSR